MPNELSTKTDEIKKFISFCYEHDYIQIGVIVRNNTTLFGYIREQMRDFNGNITRNCLTENPGYLELYYDLPYKEVSVFIPCEDILGLFEFPVVQETYPSTTPQSEDNDNDGSIHEKLFRTQLIEKAQQLGYSITYPQISYSLSEIIDFFDYRKKITFDKSDVLYVDYNYFERKNRGLTSFGIGVPDIISPTLGWEEGIEHTYYKQFKNKKLSTIISKGEHRVEGYIRFFDLHLVNKNMPTTNTIRMEGKMWYPAAFSNQRITNLKDLKKVDWYLIYFEPDSFKAPVKTWYNVEQKLTLLVEVIVIPTAISCKYGKSNLLIKARAAACIGG